MARSERFVMPKHAAYVPRDKRQLSMVDRQLAAMRLRDEAAAMTIRTQDELVAELTDFSMPMEVDEEYGYPLVTKYMEEAFAVPSVQVPAPQKKTETSSQDSVSNEGSVPEPSGGTE